MTRTKFGDLDLVLSQPFKLKEQFLDGRYTKATHFLLPGLHLRTDLKLFAKYFANAFINDEELVHIVRNPLFVLCKTKAFDDEWKGFEQSLKSSPRCLYQYDVGKWDDDYLVMLLYEFPVAYKADYFTFLRGEYSQFSEQYKKLFAETIKNDFGETIENPLYGVIHKTPTFKSSLETVIGATIKPSYEYWEKWSADREVFRKKN